MPTSNHRRGHESPEHVALKRRTIHALRALGFLVAPEHHECDVAAIHPMTGYVVAVEIERSPRNLARNLARNRQRGCDAVWIVAPTPAVRHSLRRALAAICRPGEDLPSVLLPVQLNPPFLSTLLPADQAAALPSLSVPIPGSPTVLRDSSPPR